ncbi:MAG: hypothetical protein ABI151_08205 [Chitinophagaceae bacterium]
MEKSLFIQDVIFKLSGKQITKTIVGGSNGSIIILRIGINEFSFKVNCVWRLEMKNQMITGWNESNDSLNGVMTKEIKRLNGDTIKSVKMSDFFDLQLEFSSGKVLNIFCDVTPNYEPSDYDENWSLCDIKSNDCKIISKDFAIITTTYT